MPRNYLQEILRNPHKKVALEKAGSFSRVFISRWFPERFGPLGRNGHKKVALEVWELQKKNYSRLPEPKEKDATTPREKEAPEQPRGVRFRARAVAPSNGKSKNRNGAPKPPLAFSPLGKKGNVFPVVVGSPPPKKNKQTTKTGEKSISKWKKTRFF